MKKCRDFCWGLGGFVLTLSVILFAFFSGGMFPFGWGTVSWCDMNQQVIPLFCDLKDILAGEQSLFLNTANAGGMNFYGVFFFFLSSPLSLLVALVEKSHIPLFMNLLVALKLAISGFTASFALKKLNSKLNFGAVTALGSAYALCGYGMLFYQNIMWLDVMYAFPLVTLGCYRLIEKNKPALLAVSLSVCVVLNFYISFMVFLFVIFFFGVFALTHRGADRKIYVNLGFAGAFSLGATAVVWLPCLLQYTSSARGGGVFAELKEASVFTSYDTTLPILLLSGIILAGLMLFIPRFYSACRELKLIFYVFLLTAIPLIIEPVNLMWHTGSYMSFPARYGFITAFMGILLASGLLNGERYSENSKSRAVPWVIFIAVLLSFGIVFTRENIDTLSVYVGSLWGDRYSLMGHFVLSAVFVSCFIICKILVKNKISSKRLTAVLLCFIVAVQGITSVKIYMLSAQNRLSLYNYQSVIALKDKTEKGGFYRVNTENKITDANMTGSAGFNSLGHYTSLNSQVYMETAKKLGYSGYWMETGNWGGSILSDALMSVGYTARLQNRNYVITENPYFLGLGIKAEGEIPESLGDGDRLSLLGQAFGKMTETESAVKKYLPKKTQYCDIYHTNQGYIISTTAETGVINYRIDVDTPTTLYFDCYNGFSNNLTEEINNSFAVYADGEMITECYPSQNNNGLLCLGSFKSGTVDITLQVFNNVSAVSFGVFGINELALKKTVSSAESLNLKYEGSSISGRADVGNYFISIPDTDGLKITLDGEKLDYTLGWDGFIAVNIPRSGQLEITLIPDGFYLGLIISLIGLIALIWLIIRKNTKIRYEKFNNIIYGMFLGVFVFAVALVYIMPIIVSLWDFKL